nr:S8 family serine peptidase [Novosphingobium sp. SG751A]
MGIAGALLLAAAGPALAQLGLPAVGQTLGGAVDRLRGTLDGAATLVARPLEDVAALADLRLARLDAFVRRNRNTVAMDANGSPARAHELLLLDPDPAALMLAEKSGYRLMEQGDLEGLGVGFARLETPAGVTLPDATRALQKLLPAKTVTADQIHFPGGQTAPASGPSAMPSPRGGTVGLIDGGIRPDARLAAQAGFAIGAPRPNQHAQSIASLLGGAGVAHVFAADVYGADPAGGNALAIAKALGWMAQQRVPVVSISLVGPANPLLERAVAAAQARGMFVVAAVGNDGAASPLSYPASYRDVVAVTGVDGKGRVLFEAGRASHLDYAAPGADMTAVGLAGRVTLRGTSFAAPLVAARLAAYAGPVPGAGRSLVALDREAEAAGGRAGRGILCNSCRKGI